MDVIAGHATATTDIHMIAAAAHLIIDNALNLINSDGVLQLTMH